MRNAASPAGEGPTAGGSTSSVADLARRLVPGWVRNYRRQWLGADLIAGIIVWSVVTPQCVAYAQIAGLPPQAGLMAAPGAMIGYALIGGSRSLVVSATTATSAVSASAVGLLAHGDIKTFAMLSAALALATALVLVGAGLLRLGGISDLVSKPVMTGMLFGVGLTITLDQLPKVFGVKAGSGNFFARLGDLFGRLGSTHAATFAVGAGSIVLLVALKRLLPRIPGTLVVLAAAITLSALLHLPDHGVEVIGKLPTALPNPSLPKVSGSDFVALLPAAFGVMLVSTEAVGVARTLASQQRYSIDANRELIAIGTANLLAGCSQGFVQSGGASQTAAADAAGGKTQLASVSAAGLVLLTGAFLAPVFKDLPEATLAAIVIVAVSSFFRIDELVRFASLRRSAILLALLTLAGVLGLGILRGLILAAALSLMLVIYRLSRPEVSVLARDPHTGAWGAATRHEGWQQTPGTLVARVDGPLFYGNSLHVKEWLLALVARTEPTPAVVVLDLAQSVELDVESLDALSELGEALAAEAVELQLTSVHEPAQRLLQVAGVTQHARIQASIAEAILSRPPGLRPD
ncbi:MAG TPA: SulP family inorganic anion transporter [Solirubrobacteraceae bacterium]